MSTPSLPMFRLHLFIRTVSEEFPCDMDSQVSTWKNNEDLRIFAHRGTVQGHEDRKHNQRLEPSRFSKPYAKTPRRTSSWRNSMRPMRLQWEETQFFFTCFLSFFMEAIAIRLEAEAIASRLEAIITRVRLEAIAFSLDAFCWRTQKGLRQNARRTGHQAFKPIWLKELTTSTAYQANLSSKERNLDLSFPSFHQFWACESARNGVNLLGAAQKRTRRLPDFKRSQQNKHSQETDWRSSKKNHMPYSKRAQESDCTVGTRSRAQTGIYTQIHGGMPKVSKFAYTMLGSSSQHCTCTKLKSHRSEGSKSDRGWVS